MRGRMRMVALAVGAMTVAGAGAGAVAAKQSGSDSASGLAGAINERAGTSLTGEQIQGAMKDLMAERRAAEVAAGRLTQAQADEMAANAPDGLPMFGGPGHHHGAPGVRVEIIAPVADLLTLEETALRGRVDAGDTLAEVATDQGVGKESLVAGIAAALQAAQPAGVPERTDAQITEMATRIAEGAGPCVGGEGGPGGGPGGGGAVAPPADDAGGASETPTTPAPATPSV